MTTEWVLDVTFDPPCFCPFDRATGEVIVGMSLIADSAPGPLIGVFHADGQDEVEAWVAAHPDWATKYHGTSGHSDDDPECMCPACYSIAAEENR